MSDPVDWTDPCARAAALRAAYFQVVSGGREVEIRTRTLDAEEMVRFQAADVDALRSEWQSAEDACVALRTGQPSRQRFAISARFKRGLRDPRVRGIYS